MGSSETNRRTAPLKLDQVNGGSILTSGGGSILASVEDLGPASVTLTLDTYSHVLPTMQQQAAEKLEAVLFGGRG